MLLVALALMMTSYLQYCCLVHFMGVTIWASLSRRMTMICSTGGRSSLLFKSGHAQYCLPYHKGDPFCHGTDVIFTSQDVANSVSLLKEYLILCDQIHEAKTALFLCDSSVHPSHSWFKLKFFTILDCQYGGHSLQTGYGTFLASLGVSETVIQVVGHWSSEAWKIYIHENPALIMEQQLASM